MIKFSTILDHDNGRKGFALISVLSLIVLLAIIATGLLTLSTLSLRSSNSDRANKQAQANAKLAVNKAIGELQKHSGVDTSITANSTILGDDVVQKHIVGVWNSRAFDPLTPSSLIIDRDKEFRTWLSSDSDKDALSDINYVKTAPADSVILLSSEVTSPGAEVKSGLIPVESGHMAYCVFDEGQKANVSMGYKDPQADLYSQSSVLGSGQRPKIELIEDSITPDLSIFSLETSSGDSLLSRMLTRRSAEIAHNTDAGVFSEHFHDLTTESMGVLTDVARGGLKLDLNLLAEIPPSALSGQTIYNEAFGLSTPSDPSWDRMIDYLNFYRARDASDNLLINADNNVPVVTAYAPPAWSAGQKVVSGSAVPNAEEPDAPVLLPAIAKVQMIFSLAARDIYDYPITSDVQPDSSWLHAPWCHFFKENWIGSNLSGVTNDSEYDYLLHLVYTPVITLHNPYNVEMEFNDLRVEFVDVPFSLQVFRNGIAQSNGLVPANAMYGDLYSPYESKRFGLTLTGKDASGVPDGSPVRLAPGEVKIFSPYIDPDRTWAEEIRNSKWFVDWANYNSEDRTEDIGKDVDTSIVRAVSGWRGDGIGFDLDSFAPGGYNVSRFEVENGLNYRRNQCIGLRKSDDIHVEFAPLPDPSRNSTSFTLEMTLIGANPNVDARSSVIEFEFENFEGLQTELLGMGNTLRYPTSGSINTMEIFDHSSVAIGSISNTRPFALFSAYAKTTQGGYGGTMENGSYASKPWSFHNHCALTASQNIVTEHAAHHTHEINFERLPGHTDEIIEIEPGTDRGQAITAQNTLLGTRLGAIHEIPLGPVQRLSALNISMPAATYNQPRFTRPIGNSYAHPLLNLDVVVNGGELDHSFLLNAALYDRFYCSGFQAREGAFGDEVGLTALTQGFFSENPILTDTRLKPYMSDGALVPNVVAELSLAGGYEKVAAYQLVKGAFNVNSTSVPAWKAILASMRSNGGQIIDVPNGAGAVSVTSLDDAEDVKGARLSRFQLPNDQAGSTSSEAYWQSSIDLSEVELQVLAEKIVKHIKLRGPFLSVADFVNRPLGGVGDISLKGVLQAAIDDTDINASADLYGFNISSDDVTGHELVTPEAMYGASAQGAPGYLTQEELLSVLGNATAVRSDTFTIRSYGDSRNQAGDVIARAWCEVTVQRLPEFIDPTDAALTPIEEVTTINATLGRKYVITNFRWLSEDEV